jgi:Holliday junction resolvase
MGGRAPYAKGYRGEKYVQGFLEEMGFEMVRVPLSGAAAGFPGDLMIRVKGRDDLIIEVKVRGDGFKSLYQWLTKADILVVKADRKDALAVVRLEFLAYLLQRAYA